MSNEKTCFIAELKTIVDGVERMHYNLNGSAPFDCESFTEKEKERYEKQYPNAGDVNVRLISHKEIDVEEYNDLFGHYPAWSHGGGFAS